MGLGSTAKKLQKVTNAAEELYAKMNEVIGQINALRDEVEETSQQVDRIEYDVAQQRAIVEALAAAEGLDLDDVLASADLPAELTGDETDDDSTQSADGTTETEGDAVDSEEGAAPAEQDESQA